MAIDLSVKGDTPSCKLTLSERGVAELTLNRPEVLNALDDNLLDTLTSSFVSLQNDPAVRVITLRGANNHFCAGVDISWMQNLAASGPSDDARRLAALLFAVRSCSKPTIAIIEGVCMGGGAALASCCDIAIAAENTTFSLPAVRLGAAPAIVAPFILEAIGERQARRYLLTGEQFSAERAQQLGLIHTISAGENLQEIADGFIENLLQGGPQAIKITKQIIDETLHAKLDRAALERAAKLTGAIRKSDEAQEGLAAFKERRPPKWS